MLSEVSIECSLAVEVHHSRLSTCGGNDADDLCHVEAILGREGKALAPTLDIGKRDVVVDQLESYGMSSRANMEDVFGICLE